MLLGKDLFKSFSTHKIKCVDLFLFVLKICIKGGFTAKAPLILLQIRPVCVQDSLPESALPIT